MKNFAWINKDNNLIENIIIYDGVTPITIPNNIMLLEITNTVQGSWSMLGIGWYYIDGQFVEPPKPLI